jgi:peptidoglycan/xylan/chitin deacetylase (PgdA/CDA1 family)
MVGDGTLRRIPVPILMYHYVSPLPPNADNIRIGLTLDPTIFRQHIQYLYDEGYTGISLYEMNDALENGTTLAPKSIILTFDDGYIDHYTTVFPILQEFGFTGTFFIVTAFIDNNLPGYMNWQQITEMANAGMSLEAHTKNHADLRNRDYDFLVYEIMGSFESIEAHTGIESRMFAYPVGHYDDTTLIVLDSTPALGAVTTQIGLYHTTDNYLEIPRMRINNDTTVSGLAYLLNYGR